MVDLADFMANLDQVVSGLEACVFRFHKNFDYESKHNLWPNQGQRNF